MKTKIFIIILSLCSLTNQSTVETISPQKLDLEPTSLKIYNKSELRTNYLSFPYVLNEVEVIKNQNA